MLVTVMAILILLFAVNTVTYLLFGYDKVAAEEGRRRVPERTLLTWAVFGGTPAAYLASDHFRHKTRKAPFRKQLHAVAILQLTAVACLGTYQMFGP